MRVNFVPVPARCLPEGVNVCVTEGSVDVVYLVNESASIAQLCQDLSRVATEYAASAWVHVGMMDDHMQEAG